MGVTPACPSSRATESVGFTPAESQNLPSKSSMSKGRAATSLQR